MIVTIDGPAGTGKSTVARSLAERLGFAFLNTGAMYRAVGLACLNAGINPCQEDAVAPLVEQLTLDFQGDCLFLDGVDVSEQIRVHAVTDAASLVAALPLVREELVQQQRRIGQGTNLVTEGRDQGTVVFPQAEFKFFLTASPEVRAQRRVEEVRRKGGTADLAEVLAHQHLRDKRDESRSHGPLKAAVDALTIDTSEVSVEEVVTRLENLVRQKSTR